MGGMVNNVINQAYKTIDEIIPRARLVSQTAFDEVAVDIGQRHVRVLWSEVVGRPIARHKHGAPQGRHPGTDEIPRHFTRLAIAGIV